ncbi:hypothetical protein RM572_27955 [Streptomyces sp. DSM 42041]|uniref:Uncharacterized protein n=1 Tax=Streptomyces hazeniae TaxID=3075538 RepID=A0ABU2P3W3_9ACTN|nr:hypothetical protein [Streptomyces sp. DSM 42041]MDT0382593.1 hypothetical protein [Streptomyces sp. DSM 42041]
MPRRAERPRACLGRALGQEPGEGKVARIIVPVYLAPGERPYAMMMSSGAYRPLVQVLQGLRAHDEWIVQRLMLATRTASGEPTAVLELDAGTPDSAGAGHSRSRAADEHDQEQPDGGEHGQEEDGPEQEGEDGGRGVAVGGDAAGVPLLRFSQSRDPAVIARWLRTRVIQRTARCG